MKIRDDIMLYGKLAQQELGWVAGQIEVISACFQKCKHCSSWRDNEHKGEINLESVEHLVHNLANSCLPAHFEHLTLTGGDPQAWTCLDSFLHWWYNFNEQHNIDLQISTALAKDIQQPDLWRHAVNDLRVSIDACSEAMYHRIRGDINNNFETIITRIDKLRHPNLAIIITMYQESIVELLPLLDLLDNLHRKGLPLRKIIIMVGIGVSLTENFWDMWKSTKKWAKNNLHVPTSFADDIVETRKLCKKNNHVLCWASKIGFHIKVNGDMYPCCLVGGEAIEVRKEFCMGNVFVEKLQKIYERYQPTRYGMKPICKEICQFKQFQINLAGDLANKTKLAIP